MVVISNVISECMLQIKFVKTSCEITVRWKPQTPVIASQSGSVNGLPMSNKRQFEPMHYNDVIMSTMASQITSLKIVYSTIYSRCRWKKISKLCVTGLCAGNSPVTGEFPAQRASNVENVSIWWHHHGWPRSLSSWGVTRPQGDYWVYRRSNEVSPTNTEETIKSFKFLIDPIWPKSFHHLQVFTFIDGPLYLSCIHTMWCQHFQQNTVTKAHGVTVSSNNH